MNGLISLENMSLRPVSKEILELNEVSSKYGLVLTEEEARELSDTRNKTIVENDRVEIGTGAVTKIIERFCTSRYITKENYTEFLASIGIKPAAFIPVSAMLGDNIASHSPKTPWYKGADVLEQLDCFLGGTSDDDKPFRMPVEDVYKFTEGGDDRRIVAGMCESGTLRAGDDIIFYPSGKTTRVKHLEEWFMYPSPEREPKVFAQGKSCGFTTETQIYVHRGEIACKVGEKAPLVFIGFINRP